MSGYLEVVEIVKVNPGSVINQLYSSMKYMMDRSYLKELLSSWLNYLPLAEENVLLPGKLMMVCVGKYKTLFSFSAYPFPSRVKCQGKGAGADLKFSSVSRKNWFYRLRWL